MYFSNKKEVILNKVFNNKELQQELYQEMNTHKNKLGKFTTVFTRVFLPLSVEVPLIALLVLEFPLIRVVGPMLMLIFFMIFFLTPKKDYDKIFNWFLFTDIKQSYIDSLAEKKVSLEGYEILTKYLEKEEMSVLLDSPLSYSDLSVNEFPKYLKENNLKQKEKEVKERMKIENSKKQETKEKFIDNLYKNKNKK